MQGEQARWSSAADVVEITQLVLGEREAISLGWWRQAADCYEDDAHVALLGFQGSAQEYLDHRRQEFERGTRVRWRLYVPLVHLNLDRAVVTVDAVGVLTAAQGKLRATTEGTLVFRVRRRSMAWRVVGIDLSSWEGVSPSLVRRDEGTGVCHPGLERQLRGGTSFDQATDWQARYEEALAWADLSPGLDPPHHGLEGAYGGAPVQ